MLAADAGRAWARVPRSAAVCSFFEPRLRLGVHSAASGDGGPLDSFEDLETSRIARIPRGLRVTCGLGSVEPGNSLAHFGSDRPASRRALGRLMDTTALDWVFGLCSFRVPRSAKRPERNDDGHELVSRRNVWGTPWR